MRFERITPPLELKTLIECYWTVEDDDPSPQIQKIIPDGFPEVIFHFGDPYRIKLLDRWETQDKNLLAGQITKFFFLQNTGRSEILGIKFKPQGLAHLFNIPMHILTDKVLNLNDVMMDQWGEMERVVRVSQHMTDRITLVESYLKELITPQMTREEAIDLALLAIFSARGAISVAEIGRAAAISERQLERLFKHYVGPPESSRSGSARPGASPNSP